MKLPYCYLQLLLLLFLLSSILQAQPLLTQSDKSQIIRKTSQLIENKYPLEEEGVEMAALIQRNFNKGLYDEYSVTLELSRAVNRDLWSVAHDKHLALVDENFAQKMRDSTNAALNAANPQMLSWRMVNNSIGIIEASTFWFKKPLWDDAMADLNHCRALIIDVRGNPGGNGGLSTYALSYFLKPGFHFSTMYTRKGAGEKEKTKKVKGNYQLDIPIYILIDEKTFSAAEAFAYNLQALGRATIIGQTSAGGAHPKINKKISRELFLSLPTGRSESVVTGTDWEGTGVIPNIESPYAMKTAMNLALKAIP